MSLYVVMTQTTTPAATAIPASFTAGDSLELLLSAALYPPLSGWSLRIDFAGPAKPSAWNSSAAGSAHAFTLSSAATSEFAAGAYSWQLVALAENKRVTLQRGSLEVRADLASIDSSYESRSWAKQTLDAVEATLTRKATADQLSVSIAGRNLSRYSITELLTLRETLRLQLSRESGKNRSRNIYVRFGGR